MESDMFEGEVLCAASSYIAAPFAENELKLLVYFIQIEPIFYIRHWNKTFFFFTYQNEHI